MTSIHPVLTYNDAHAAIDFLERAFGFERLGVFEADDGKVAHAELGLDGALFGLSSVGAGDPMFAQGAGRTSVYIAVSDVDAVCDRARSAGATIEMEPTDQDYGSRDFVARDPEGNLWCFGTYELGSSGTP